MIQEKLLFTIHFAIAFVEMAELCSVLHHLEQLHFSLEDTEHFTFSILHLCQKATELYSFSLKCCLIESWYKANRQKCCFAVCQCFKVQLRIVLKTQVVQLTKTQNWLTCCRSFRMRLSCNTDKMSFMYHGLFHSLSLWLKTCCQSGGLNVSGCLLNEPITQWHYCHIWQSTLNENFLINAMLCFSNSDLIASVYGFIINSHHVPSFAVILQKSYSQPKK